MSAESDPGIDTVWAATTWSRPSASDVLASVQASIQAVRACEGAARPPMSPDEKRSMFGALYGASGSKIVELLSRSEVSVAV